VVAQGDKVAVRTVQRGTHQVEFFGVAPTGRRVEFSAIAVYRLEEGLIVEEWIEADRLGLLAQLGVLTLPLEAGGVPRR
jgi:predicted ester cyclase